jgi:hypothetical protein
MIQESKEPGAREGSPDGEEMQEQQQQQRQEPADESIVGAQELAPAANTAIEAEVRVEEMDEKEEEEEEEHEPEQDLERLIGPIDPVCARSLASASVTGADDPPRHAGRTA